MLGCMPEQATRPVAVLSSGHGLKGHDAPGFTQAALDPASLLILGSLLRRPWTDATPCHLPVCWQV